jgi:hypothetical protein
MTVQAIQTRGGISARAAVLAYVAVCGLVLLIMMALGLTMRLAQAQWINVQPDFFYVVMTMHGAGMVGIAGLSGAAVMWYFVRRYVPVSTAVFVANLVLFLIGALFILGAGFIGGFGAAWTFLFPLPAYSGALWSNNAAACYLVGLLLIGVGFLLLHLDIARGILSVYGSLGNALGARQAFGLAKEDAGPPPAVAASTMVLIVNILGILFGAVVMVVSLVNLYVPSFSFDALAAKNMICRHCSVRDSAGLHASQVEDQSRLLFGLGALHDVRADRLSAPYAHGLRHADLGVGRGPGRLLAQRAAGPAGNGLRRAHQCLPVRDQVERGSRPGLHRRRRLGHRCRPCDCRRHHRGQQRHA